MKKQQDDMNIVEHLSKATRLCLVPAEKRNSLLPDPELKTLIEEMKGKQKRKPIRLMFDDGHDAA